MKFLVLTFFFATVFGAPVQNYEKRALGNKEQELSIPFDGEFLATFPISDLEEKYIFERIESSCFRLCKLGLISAHCHCSVFDNRLLKGSQHYTNTKPKTTPKPKPKPTTTTTTNAPDTTTAKTTTNAATTTTTTTINAVTSTSANEIPITTIPSTTEVVTTTIPSSSLPTTTILPPTTVSKPSTIDIDLLCGVMCRDGLAGDECNCADHPFG